MTSVPGSNAVGLLSACNSLSNLPRSSRAVVAALHCDAVRVILNHIEESRQSRPYGDLLFGILLSSAKRRFL